MEFGFSHCYHLHLSLFPYDSSSFSDRLNRALRMMKEAGATAFRPHVHWNRVEPLILNPGIRLENVTDRMVAEYAAGKDGLFWEETDMMVKAMLEHGLKPYLCLGAGYIHQLPLFEKNKNIVKFIPDSAGQNAYLGHLFLHARAVVRRYRDRCHHWQLENELNAAGETAAVARWRTGKRWFSPRFQTAIMETLHRAVKMEAPDALTTHNICGMAFKILPRVYSWQQDILKWNKYMDFIGFDPFPNFTKGEPLRVKSVVRRAMQEIDKLKLNKPVYILEDGYPVKPESRGYSEENQVRYFQELLEVCAETGVSGLFIYCFSSQEGAPGNEWHTQKGMNDIEHWWGVVRADGSVRPAYDFLVRKMSRTGGLDA